VQSWSGHDSEEKKITSLPMTGIMTHTNGSLIVKILIYRSC